MQDGQIVTHVQRNVTVFDAVVDVFINQSFQYLCNKEVDLNMNVGVKHLSSKLSPDSGKTCPSFEE